MGRTGSQQSLASRRYRALLTLIAELALHLDGSAAGGPCLGLAAHVRRWPPARETGAVRSTAA